MTQVIVSTTINSPTEAIRRFDSLPDWHLVVIGDKKTPGGYVLDRGTYIGPDDQERIDKELSDAIGWNSIQRRNFGFIVAKQMAADVVACVDDDNLPYPEWGKDLLVGRATQVNMYETDLPVFDPIGATNYPHLWHRGYPLQLLATRDYSRRRLATIVPQVQADFWNGDPDVDAICRMEHAPNCRFDESLFPLASQTMAPFDSQNTFVAGELLADYFLFPHVGRMDDIWASYYVQARGAVLVFGKPSVTQERNVHDLTEDMRKEYLGYEHNLALVSAVKDDPEALLAFLPERARDAFVLYRRHF